MQKDSEAGFLLSELLILIIVGTLLSGALSEFYRIIHAQMNWQRAQWQAFERLQLARAILKHDIEQAGFWGTEVFAEPSQLPIGLEGGKGKVFCTAHCHTDHERYDFQGTQNSALIVRYAIAKSIHWPQLPNWSDSSQNYYYASAYYIDGSPSGLYQRLNGYQQSAELVRGIDHFACRFALFDPFSTQSFRWQSLETIKDFSRVIGLSCEIEAVSDPVIEGKKIRIARQKSRFKWFAYNLWNRQLRQQQLLKLIHGF